MKKTILLLLSLILLLGASPYRRTFLLMGTFVEITIPKKDRKFIAETVKEMQTLEKKLSIYRKGSEINKINSLKKGELKKISPEAYEVIQRSVYFSKLTDGAFDITVSPLLKLWDFEGGSLKNTPSQEKINEALKAVGWQNIILTPNGPARQLAHQSFDGGSFSGGKIGFSEDNMSINLGGIAKGYIVDKGVVYLKEKGIKSALINAGGDVYCFGEKDDGELWNIGIQHPRKKNETIGTLTLTDKAVTTSGDYEKFITLKGKRFSHIIDSKTGSPVDNKVIQATVVAQSCTDADALATALMVMGKEKGLKLIENLPNTEAVIIEHQEDKLDISYTEGLEGIIKINEN